MATIETPPKPDREKPSPRRERGGVRPIKIDEEDFHLLLSELRDDNSRSRMREAAWISIVVHLVVLFAIREAPKWLPARNVELVSPADQVRRSKDLTFLEASPDKQVVTKRPDTNKISDKDRIAASRTPQLKKKDLQDLIDARRQGAPGPTTPAQQPQQQLAQNSPSPQQGGGQQPQQAPESSPQSNSVQSPAVQRNPFALGGSAGSAINQAARASAQTRGGGGGEYGSVPGSPNTQVASQYDILSDTQGVDFGPYLQRVLQSVRSNWYTLIPEVARPPLLKRGTVSVEFVITKNGSVAGMRLAGPSGDVSLDRAAWGGITASNPFPPLPSEFRGEYLALRFHFIYNPERNQLQ
jgi:TonB family protein